MLDHQVSMYSCIQNCQSGFPKNYNILNSSFRWIRVPAVLHQYLILSGFLVLASGWSMPSLVLTGAFLMISDANHFYVLINSLYISFHEGSVLNWLLKFYWDVYLLLLICRSSLNILNTHLLSGICVLNTFSQPIAAFYFVKCVSKSFQCFKFINFILFVFFYGYCLFVS